MVKRLWLTCLISLLFLVTFAQKKGQQYLVFQITPAMAILEVNDQIWELDAEGKASGYLDFGTYSYRVQTKNYHDEEGQLTLNDSDNVMRISIVLRPKFGWIEVTDTDELRGASVFIDNTMVGKAPCKSGPLTSGNHVMRIAKEMYGSYSVTVIVKDNETTTVTPSLTKDFTEVTLEVDADAEIWVNDEWKGVRTWKGFLSNGICKIECKMPGSESSLLTREISSEMEGQTIILPVPISASGSLSVESSPMKATLYLDDVEMGFTPKLLRDIPVGRHEIRIVKEGFAPHTETITVSKGSHGKVKATLANVMLIKFNCNVADAQLTVDDVLLGPANGSYKLTRGTHIVKATAENFIDYNNTITIEGDIDNYIIVMMKSDCFIKGTFSVSDTKKVYFSKGNLQYKPTSQLWRFAEQQYSFVGDDNKGISAYCSGWIDLFGWGTSGYNGRKPILTNNDAKEYGDNDKDIAGTMYDWGVYNPIEEAGNKSGIWRTLTKDEWIYLFETRHTTSGIRYAKARVNGVDGLILLPDNWNANTLFLIDTNDKRGQFEDNKITASQWENLERLGVVFLPAAGSRYMNEVYPNRGCYWSSSANGEDHACYLKFNNKSFSPEGTGASDRFYGYGVRLVIDTDSDYLK